MNSRCLGIIDMQKTLSKTLERKMMRGRLSIAVFQNKTYKYLSIYGKIFLHLFCLASPIWVGWAKIHTKTLLDVYLPHPNFANLYREEETATGTSISVMTIQSLRFWRGVSAYHPWRGLATLLIFLDGQRRPGCGISRVRLPRLFFVHLRFWGDYRGDELV